MSLEQKINNLETDLHIMGTLVLDSLVGAVRALEDKDTLKASAKAKLIAGEALTEDEANTKAAELSGSDSSGRKYIVKDIG